MWLPIVRFLGLTFRDTAISTALIFCYFSFFSILVTIWNVAYIILETPFKKHPVYCSLSTTFKIIKTEFAFNKIFNSFEELEYLLFDYVNWFNNKRIHGALGYMTPTQYKNLVSA